MPTSNVYAPRMSLSIEALRAGADRAGLFLDFDGTLSEIVDEPDLARPLDGVVEVLSGLSKAYRNVSIVSGRSAEQLLDWLGSGVDIWGVHGAQRVRNGRVELSNLAAPFEPRMQQALADARDLVGANGLEGLIVEDKSVMVGLHYRAASDRDAAAAALEEIARVLAAKHGLDLARGRMALELRPPIRFSKGDIVLEVAEESGLEAAMFAGDDVVDLPGFDALDRLEGSGLGTLRVAVASNEAPAELVERADLTVPGPPGMLELLSRLL